MKLSTNEIIKEYYEKVREDYPDLTFEECKLIVTSPFKMVKDDMENAELSTCRLKYLGTFFVYPKKAQAALKTLTEKFKRHEIDRTEYFELKSKIEKFLDVHTTN